MGSPALCSLGSCGCITAAPPSVSRRCVDLVSSCLGANCLTAAWQGLDLLAVNRNDPGLNQPLRNVTLTATLANLGAVAADDDVAFFGFGDRYGTIHRALLELDAPAIAPGASWSGAGTMTMDLREPGGYLYYTNRSGLCWALPHCPCV